MYVHTRFSITLDYSGIGTAYKNVRTLVGGHVNPLKMLRPLFLYRTKPTTKINSVITVQTVSNSRNSNTRTDVKIKVPDVAPLRAVHVFSNLLHQVRGGSMFSVNNTNQCGPGTLLQIVEVSTRIF